MFAAAAAVLAVGALASVNATEADTMKVLNRVIEDVQAYVQEWAEAGGPLREDAQEALTKSFAMIVATELGDKTFFIAALMAMRHSRRSVFLGAAGALAAMTILSAGIGKLLPTLLPPLYTHWAAVLLFIFFGTKQLFDAASLFAQGEGIGPSDELEEVEQSLKGEASSRSVLLTALTLTFLAEWGDRSQLATIAMAASKDWIGVMIGGSFGHAFCTSLAVIGGRLLSSSISERLVLAAGGALFLAFGTHGAISGPES